MTGVKETGAVTVLQAPVASGPCPANQNLDHKLRRTERSWNHSAWEIWILEGCQIRTTAWKAQMN
jgi:hypothetical protein